MCKERHANSLQINSKYPILCVLHPPVILWLYGTSCFLGGCFRQSYPCLPRLCLPWCSLYRHPSVGTAYGRMSQDPLRPDVPGIYARSHEACHLSAQPTQLAPMRLILRSQSTMEPLLKSPFLAFPFWMQMFSCKTHERLAKGWGENRQDTIQTIIPSLEYLFHCLLYKLTSPVSFLGGVLS